MVRDEPDPPDQDRPGSPGADDLGADAAGGDASGDEPASELRAKDLVGMRREELEAELDPATMAELASWFARPNGLVTRAREVPDEVRAGAVSGKALDDFERLGAAMGVLDDDRSEVRAAAIAAVDPTMVELLDRHTRAADAILPARPEVEPTIDETIVPAAVRALIVAEGEEQPSLGEPRLVQIPPDIEALLERDNAPQAVLRDLARPVEEFELRLEPAFPPPPADEDMSHALRDALRWRPELVPARVPPLDLRAEWRPLHRQPWPDLVKAAKAVRQAEIEAADAQMAADAADGIVWRW
jgi:hypothetical protein